LGAGDIKLLSLTALFASAYLTVGIIFAGFIVGALYALYCLATKKKKKNEPIPLVPSLYIGTILVFAAYLVIGL
jgi:Flp pilus assembly protein protease CpaA